jgi:DNA modification methylase
MPHIRRIFSITAFWLPIAKVLAIPQHTVFDGGAVRQRPTGQLRADSGWLKHSRRSGTKEEINMGQMTATEKTAKTIEIGKESNTESNTENNLPAIQIINGNALDVLRTMPPQIFDCVVTSPPYFNLRDYGTDGQIGLEATPDEYIDKLVDTFREARRALKDDGTLWIVINDSYAGSRKGGANYPGKAIGHKQGSNRGSVAAPLPTRVPANCKPKDLIGIPWMLAFALRSDGWYLRQDIVWQKPDMFPEPVRDRCTHSYEHIFMLSKATRYYYDSEAIREPAVSSGNKQRGSRKEPAGKLLAPTRNKRDIWTISKSHVLKGEHYAAFPPKLAEPMVLAGCRPGGRVLDPFCGSGTTGAVAKQLGRSFTGIDISAKYCEMARQRINSGR